jgi:hypothetical protein
MKQIILLFILLVFSTTIIAQPGNSRLDADLKRLNGRFQRVESIKRLPKDGNSEIRIKRAIETAERELGRFKKKYPDQDVSKFERALANFQNPNSNSKNPETPENKSASNEVSDFAKVENFVETIDEILSFYPPVSKFISNIEGTSEKTKQQLKEFQLKMNQTITPEFIALGQDDSVRKVQRAANKAKQRAGSIQTELAQIDINRIQAETKENLMLAKYYQILFKLEQVKQLKRIFSGDPNINSANDTAEKLIAKLGTSDDIEKRSRENYAAKVAENRMFAERQNNQALRNLASSAFRNSVYRSKDKVGQILKVHLVSNGWSVTRNKLTGIILSRDQQVQIAYKATDGKCYTYLMLLEQKHQGGGKYGGAYDRSGSKQEILCTNVPK